jgi:hypothetical protein
MSSGSLVVLIEVGEDCESTGKNISEIRKYWEKYK